MRQRNRSELPDARVTKHWRDDAVADVKRPAWQAASVHEERRPARKANQRGVALADIDERNMQPAVAHGTHSRPGLGNNPERAQRSDGGRSPAQPTGQHSFGRAGEPNATTPQIPGSQT